jgi:hypothetical protein
VEAAAGGDGLEEERAVPGVEGEAQHAAVDVRLFQVDDLHARVGRVPGRVGELHVVVVVDGPLLVDGVHPGRAGDERLELAALPPQPGLADLVVLRRVGVALGLRVHPLLHEHRRVVGDQLLRGGRGQFVPVQGPVLPPRREDHAVAADRLDRVLHRFGPQHLPARQPVRERLAAGEDQPGEGRQQEGEPVATAARLLAHGHPPFP